LLCEAGNEQSGSRLVKSTQAFIAARDFLLAHREDYEHAYRHFRWPRLDDFNWALDFFDEQAEGNERTALRIVEQEGSGYSYSFMELRDRSNRAANFLRCLGVARGDRVLVMLPNVVALWEILLATMKLGAIVSPASMLLSSAELADRMVRGEIRHLITDEPSTAKFAAIKGSYTRVSVGSPVPNWIAYASADSAMDEFQPDSPTRIRDPFLLYFTSGTTARPKMVLHTFESYPIGHLSTMYWIGLRPNDVHWNISSPGWAKHAWCSFFAPWNAGATVYVYNQPRFEAEGVLKALVRDGISSLCAPPTVWRALILLPIADYRVTLRQIVGAGEPLNPEVIDKVRSAWGITIRDGYGQTETTCLIGNSPGQPLKPGSMGRPMPGYSISLLGPDYDPHDGGEINIELRPEKPAGLMAGYVGEPQQTLTKLGGNYFSTSDVARRDTDGYYWYIGRNDDVFKSSDYRISPFELESLLLEHDAVAEAAVVPSPDALRLAVPKAFVVLKPGVLPSPDVAKSVLRFVMERAPTYRRVRRIEFCELPKTLSGKIRRVELRQREAERGSDTRSPMEFWEEDLMP
jgi:acetyl-CoA synthetase